MKILAWFKKHFIRIPFIYKISGGDVIYYAYENVITGEVYWSTSLDGPMEHSKSFARRPFLDD